MKIFKDKHSLQKELSRENRVCFVPTMGGLHKGHIHLIDKSKEFKRKILVSIFINPKQFNNKNDFFKYPRNLKKDLNLLGKLKISYVYLPNYKDIFKFKPKNTIFLDKFSKKLCGKTRKGHFKGVLNVVNRFLDLIKPKYIILGVKDFQQSYLITKHIKKRNINTKVINCKTIREKNGVACSTRNQNLSDYQLKIASKVIKYLKNNKRLIKKKLSNFNTTILKRNLKDLGVTKIDYLELFNSKTLVRPKSNRENLKIFIAYYLNKTRLIDNI